MFADESAWYPRGANIINLAEKQLRIKNYLRFRDIRPHYLRLTEAEEVVKQKYKRKRK